ncbi:MAG: tetraacyldisaccharide 4'-kinase [Verrucomicrobiota bacterium]|nr:tetraacyldisaccharide 4'-kinase [Verrucomicrobiota bacterium]
MDFNRLSENFEQYLIDIISGKHKKRKRDRTFKAFLFILSRIYRSIVQLRLSLYSERIFRQRILGCLVISVGNLTCGGTGKTPVVEIFARTLAEKGRKVAILSRGYKSKKKSLLTRIFDKILNREDPPRIVSDGKQLLLDSEHSGDEPYMLASNLPKTVVLVDKDRVKSGRYAIREMGIDTLILDDAFQYLGLRPRFNILLVDSTNPFDNHHLLPRGFLREPIKNIRRADVIFLTKSNGGKHLKHIKHFLQKHNRRAEMIECTHKPKHLADIYTGKIEDLELLKGAKIACISGIAKPEGFEAFIRGLGGEILYFERFADHHRYQQQEIINFVNVSINKGATMILTTEKDAVRFPKLDRRDLQFYFLRVEIDILSGQETFNECISRICFI